ncbi:hypothetical protein M406DRAFT_332560 [Cryphonectria parasitica EP155]|uniref:Uncharacterized protein n=1 Tax=Cryphonectria parasitica (strain ATCC 38755 / EP155) TaxID=660469 RepID=A0A9P4XVQ9_CRYP1|nr:uncharacterized protein M406DRAFT_332560 [Cryphonectria parasitica EP155]KAF3762172.1 hypothetical protein M406DRAFT_332560 [Cryphonectria parasitica EP155]
MPQKDSPMLVNSLESVAERTKEPMKLSESKIWNGTNGLGAWYPSKKTGAAVRTQPERSMQRMREKSQPARQNERRSGLHKVDGICLLNPILYLKVEQAFGRACIYVRGQLIGVRLTCAVVIAAVVEERSL